MEHSAATHSSTQARLLRAPVERPPARGTLVRLLTDWDHLVRTVRHALHLAAPLDTEDRRVLEKVIFRYYAARPDVRSVLFAGCDWRTEPYEDSYFSRHDYWTIERDEKARRYGARQHVVAPLEQLDQFFPEGYFDLIICNGVYGYGLDTPEQCETAFAQCYSRLRNEGYFVLGWDDVPRRTPVAFANIASLKRFRRPPFPPLGSSRYLTDTPYNRTYEFFSR